MQVSPDAKASAKLTQFSKLTNIAFFYLRQGGFNFRTEALHTVGPQGIPYHRQRQIKTSQPHDMACASDLLRGIVTRTVAAPHGLKKARRLIVTEGAKGHSEHRRESRYADDDQRRLVASWHRGIKKGDVNAIARAPCMGCFDDDSKFHHAAPCGWPIGALEARLGGGADVGCGKAADIGPA